MRTAEARAAIAAWVTQEVSAGFRRDAEESPISCAARRRSREKLHPAYDATQAPPVPSAVVDTRQVPSGERTGVIFTWKAEYGDPPYFIMNVPTCWPRRIVAPGWALVAGRPVADVLAWDDQRRPTRIKSVSLCSYFDSSLHGWRSWADNVEYDIDWRVPERPLLQAPAPEAAAPAPQG